MLFRSRIIPQAAVEKVAASIREFGWRQPIVVDKKGVIVAGHTRRLAAMHLKLDQVPVHVAVDLSAKAVRSYRLADNRAGEETRWNMDALAAELSALRDLDVNLLDLGFNPIELPTDVPEPEEADEADLKPLDRVDARRCPHCGGTLS